MKKIKLSEWWLGGGKNHSKTERESKQTKNNRSQFPSYSDL